MRRKTLWTVWRRWIAVGDPDLLPWGTIGGKKTFGEEDKQQSRWTSQPGGPWLAEQDASLAHSTVLSFVTGRFLPGVVVVLSHYDDTKDAVGQEAGGLMLVPLLLCCTPSCPSQMPPQLFSSAPPFAASFVSANSAFSLFFILLSQVFFQVWIPLLTVVFLYIDGTNWLTLWLTF